MLESGPPKSVTVEDSFKSCTTLQAAAEALGRLAPDLLARLREELEVGGGGLSAGWLVDIWLAPPRRTHCS